MGGVFNRVSDQNRTIQFSRLGNRLFEYPNNEVTTTKYHIITFLPKALLLQFLRPANWAYLIIAVLQSIPQLSSLAPWTAIAPLLFVLAVALLKEGISDYKRYKKDKEVNTQHTEYLSPDTNTWEDIVWSKIKVGDFVRIKNQQMIPADILLLHSSEQNSICYVQTANLDGQNNLKTKIAYDGVRLNPQQFHMLEGRVVVQSPNSNLYEFNGFVKLDKPNQRNSQQQGEIPMERKESREAQEKRVFIENLLVRGSMLKNTEIAVGVVIYAGHDTKIMRNQGQIQHKVSHVERRVNRIQFFLLLTLIFLSMGCGLGYYQIHTAYASESRKDFFYLIKTNIDRNMRYESLLVFCTCFLLLSFIIPISMNVALEGIKIFQGMFLGWDRKMFYQPLKKYCNALNLAIVEQLGVVDYVLTDKTGTLTANQMQFQYCYIEGTKYEAKQLLNDNTFGGIDFHLFWQAVIICHDVVVDTKEQQFQGSSPDEVCFVEFASKIGYRFIKRTKNSIQLEILGKNLYSNISIPFHFLLEKRMSVIVKDLETDKFYLYTKGADSSMFSQSLDDLYERTPFSKYEEKLTKFSMLGLRTLVFSMREMKNSEVQSFMEELELIRNLKFQKKPKNERKRPSDFRDSKSQLMKKDIENQENFDPQQVMEKLIQKTESELIILGISAIQDRLQDEVPETIHRLQQAGIVVMMITGDKLETAQNIGYLSKFIQRDAVVFKLRAGIKNLPDQLKTTFNAIKIDNISHFSLIIEGETISQYLKLTLEQAPEAVQLLKLCKSVIFCRSTPKEKAQIVSFVKQKLGGIVLAIGDGGNDIGMIQQANIGVGIIGKQGNQAASSSDFYFAQFKYLDRLVLHHGRWTYSRMSYFFVYYGWKNLVLTMIFLYFMSSSGFSGYRALSESFITVYNSLIALILVTYFSVLEQDINQDDYPQCYDKMPLFYKEFKERDLFSYRRYIFWTVLALALSALIHYSFRLSLGGQSILNQYGYPCDYNTYASGVAIPLSLCVIFVIIADMNNFTWFSFFGIIMILTFSPVVIFFTVENFMSMVGNQSIIYALSDNIQSIRYVATIWLILGITIACKYGYNAIMFELIPGEVEKAMEQRQKWKQQREGYDHYEHFKSVFQAQKKGSSQDNKSMSSDSSNLLNTMMNLFGKSSKKISTQASAIQ